MSKPKLGQLFREPDLRMDGPCCRSTTSGPAFIARSEDHCVFERGVSIGLAAGDRIDDRQCNQLTGILFIRSPIDEVGQRSGNLQLGAELIDMGQEAVETSRDAAIGRSLASVSRSASRLNLSTCSMKTALGMP